MSPLNCIHGLDNLVLDEMGKLLLAPALFRIYFSVNSPLHCNPVKRTDSENELEERGTRTGVHISEKNTSVFQ